ncbi:glycerate kinase [Actinomadura livida]|uniref:Glycerate kinase n=1 Tax=Actinomadura livida TaxID=79909 RepID=A0A7W7IEH6_9ACTN|nr:MULTISPECIES: glycerate kinase [Actinomadura]MBB4775525.1 glycerate kinase [Actinomadura catellatispora]GGT90930.1 glycerate kinase [Actinomadura livida]
MRVVVAPDSFKGSLSAAQVCAAVAEGVRRAVPGARVTAVPMADGGEGTLDCFRTARAGELVETAATDPLGRPVAARYALSGDGRSAVVELAAASGLPLVADVPPDPLRADTTGTGELIADAVRRGAREVLVAVGGSASTDGGTGLLRALGVRFLDAAGAELPPGGAALARLARIDGSRLPHAVRATRFRVACDVTSPLVGPAGAAAVFGPQKGASPAQVRELDAALTVFADVLAAHSGVRVHDLPGAGAAGGTCGGLVGLLGAEPSPGAPLVAEAVGLPAALDGADLVLTGEGRVDGQSAAGKVVSAVAALAAERGVPCVALAGGVAGPLDELHALGLTAAFSIADGPRDLAGLKAGAAPLLAALAEQAVRLFAR